MSAESPADCPPVSPAGSTDRGQLARALKSHLARRGRMGQRRVAPGQAEPFAPTTTGSGPAPASNPPPNLAPLPGSASAPPSQAALATQTAPGDFAHFAAKKCLNLDQLREQVSACKACDLCQSRTQTVFMDGAITPGGVMFIGDAPGTEEDLQGLPFVGQAGQLLTDIIVKGMKMRRDQVTIANVIKCHPPGSRDSKPEERARCSPFLERQIELIQPKVLIPLGENAAQHILKTDRALTALRGQIHALGALTVIPTLHPEFLLQNPAAKRDCWQDIQLAMRVAGIETDRGA